MRIYKAISIFLIFLLVGNVIDSIRVQAAETDNTGGASVQTSSEADNTGAGPAQTSSEADNTGAGTAQDAQKNTTKTKFYLDNHNRYQGMEKSYSEGYIPKVENGSVLLVVPLQYEGELKNNIIRVSLNLGEGENIPFVYKNYEKNFSKGVCRVNDGTGEAECCLVAFALELKTDRINGSYPVTLNIAASDENGNEIEQSFTVYVTITDGKDLNEGVQEEAGQEEEPPVFAPKILVESCSYSPAEIKAGDSVTAQITLVNTSKTEGVKNMTVTVTPCEGIAFAGESDSIYIEKLGVNKTTVLSLAFEIDTAAAEGQYSIGLAMDYADTKGNTYTSAATVKLPVGQLVKMQFDPLTIPEEVEMGETIEATTQAMNLGRGKVYNVRAEIAADGLKQSRTMFLGDIEAGTAVTGSVELTVEGKDGSSLYGDTKGIVTFYYEDEAGNELSESMDFSTSILSPIKEKSSAETEDDTSQWWRIMAVITGILAAVFLVYIIRRIKQRKNEAV